MTPAQIYSLLSAMQIALSIAVLVLLLRAKEHRAYWPMLFISNWQTLPGFIYFAVRRFGRGYGLPPRTAYDLYFYTYWASFALQAVLAVLLTYLILEEALRPLKGLRQLGHIIYWWTAAVGLTLAAVAANSAHFEHMELVSAVISEMQRVSGTLTLALLLLVCLTLRPLGLSLRSRVFGVGIGVLITSLTNTMQSNYFYGMSTLYRPFALVQIAVNCLAECVWIYYFFVPEPKRKFVLLSTTSPFHSWNRIAEQFGAQPGYVAIGGIPPEALASAEMEVFRRASVKMKEREEETEETTSPPELPMSSGPIGTDR